MLGLTEFALSSLHMEDVKHSPLWSLLLANGTDATKKGPEAPGTF